MNNILNKISGLRNFFEASFLVQLESCHEPSELWSACEYSLTAPGKRIRPILVFLAAEMLGVELERLQGYGAAIEFLHNSSLVHDDLPALDNDDYRRGRPTCHKQFNEPTALLAGNAMIVLAFEIISKDERLSNPEKTSLNRIIARAFYQLCVGQVMDLKDMYRVHVDRQSLSLSALEAEKKELKVRHLNKTGALIEACMLGAGTLYNGPAFDFDLTDQLRKIGQSIGLLFQITDDILDSIDEGQGLSQDEKQGISTYVSLYGLDGAKEMARKESAEATELLKAFGVGAEDLIKMVDYILKRDK